MNSAQPKKLIEVAMPVKEISAESVRDGRIQHGHIVLTPYKLDNFSF
jgi:hypothetical protein